MKVPRIGHSQLGEFPLDKAPLILLQFAASGQVPIDPEGFDGEKQAIARQFLKERTQ